MAQIRHSSSAVALSLLARCTPMKSSPYIFTHRSAWNVYPWATSSLCGYIFTQWNASHPLILSLQQHMLRWKQASHGTKPSVYRTILILCKEDTILSWTLFSEKQKKKKSGNTVVAIWYWHFTCAIHKRCYHKSVSHIPAEKPARQHMYRFRKLRVLLFPLKVDTHNRQLALVKWNNVFFSFLIYTIHTKIKN